MAGFLEKHHAIETRESISRVQKSTENSGRFKKGYTPWNKNKTKYDDPIIASIADRMIGKSPWNLGETRETNQSVESYCQNRDYKNVSDKTRKLISEKAKKRWQDPEFFDKMELLRNRSPNKKEIFLKDTLQKNFPNEWEFVGNGKFWIERRNPDYMNINGKKLLIELLGCYYHGCKICCPRSKRENDFEIRKSVFAKYGFNTLAIWEHELKDEVKLLEKISRFVGEISG